MKTDAVFYRLFETSPETLFLVLGMSAESAREMAARYQFEVLEFKETSQRVDGVFRPKEPELPLYFVEVQFYRLSAVYADLLAKAYTYLKQHDPGQSFVGIVLFGTRDLEPAALAPYRSHLDAGMIRRFYLDEMPEVPDAPLGLSILGLIRQAEDLAPARARALVSRTKAEIADEPLRSDLVQLIETIIIYKLPRLGREEIQNMLQVSDIRETRVYQEAREEGLREGVEKGIEKGIESERQRSFHEKLQSIPTMSALKLTAEDIARILQLDVELIRQELAKCHR